MDIKDRNLERIIAGIEPVDADIMEEIWDLWDKKAKPLRSLGRLEEMVGGSLLVESNCLGTTATILIPWKEEQSL